MLAKQSLLDSTRASEGKNTVWEYCHAPNSSAINRTAAIENQAERFVPGFKDQILVKAL